MCTNDIEELHSSLLLFILVSSILNLLDEALLVILETGAEVILVNSCVSPSKLTAVNRTSQRLLHGRATSTGDVGLVHVNIQVQFNDTEVTTRISLNRNNLIKVILTVSIEILLLGLW